MMSLSAPVPLVALPARRPNQTEPNASAHQSEASELRLRRPRRRQLGRVWAGNWRASSSKLGRFAAGALLAGGAGRRLASEQTSGLTKAGFLTATDHVKCRTSKLRAQKAAIGNLARASERAIERKPPETRWARCSPPLAHLSLCCRCWCRRRRRP